MGYCYVTIGAIAIETYGYLSENERFYDERGSGFSPRAIPPFSMTSGWEL